MKMNIYLGSLLCTFLAVAHAFAKLSNETEAGVVVTKGNSKTQSYSLKQMNDFDSGKNRYALQIRYLNASSGDLETARYFLLGLRYDRTVVNNFSIFIGEILERDHFAGIDKRYISDAGGRYNFIAEEKLKLSTELGYRYTVEKQNNGSELLSSSIRSYVEWEKQWIEGVTTKYWIEYLPNLSNSKDYLVNTELSLSVMFTNFLYLKTGYLLRYDNMPASGVTYKSDALLTTAIVAKF